MNNITTPYTITYPPITPSITPSITTSPGPYTFNNWDRASGMSVQGDVKVEGDLLVGKMSLQDSLDRIEERLGIAKENPELEKRWKELEELGRRYRALEKELVEKEKIWNTLKGEK